MLDLKSVDTLYPVLMFIVPGLIILSIRSQFVNYAKALELKPDHAKAYYNRGVAWLCLKNWEKARADLTSAENIGADIVALFQQEYEGVTGFEQRYDSKLPADLAAMLTPEDEDPV